MTQDYARRGAGNTSRGSGAKRTGNRRDGARRTAPAAAPPRRATLPFLVGIAVGVAGTLVIQLAGWLPAADVANPPEAGSAGSVPPAGIRFEFPDMLRDAEVLVPYVEEYLQPESRPGASPEPDVEYMLQAGAFRSAQDADRRRAAILLLDLQARTLRVTRQGESWHRVLVGPFVGRSRARDAQLRLLEDDIDSLVLRTAGDAG